MSDEANNDTPPPEVPPPTEEAPPQTEEEAPPQSVEDDAGFDQPVVEGTATNEAPPKEEEAPPPPEPAGDEPEQNGQKNGGDEFEKSADSEAPEFRGEPSHVVFNVDENQEVEATSIEGEEEDEENFFTAEKRNATGPGVSTSGVAHRSFAALSGSSADQGGKLRRETGVPLSFVVKKLAHYIDSSELTAQLFVFLPFLVCFVFFFLAGRSVEQNYYVLKGVRDRFMVTEYPNVASQLQIFKDEVLNEQRLWVELDKNFEGIGNSGDWGDWLRDVVITTTFDCKNPDKSHVLLAPSGQNYHVGALRMRTQRMPETSCDVQDVYYPENYSAFPRTCYEKHKSSDEEMGFHCNYTNPLNGDPMFPYRTCSSIPGAPLIAIEGTYHCGGFLFEIPFNATCNQAMKFYELATGGADGSGCTFVDNWATRFVVVELFIYTPQTDTFHGIKLFTEILPGGWWFNQYVYRSFQLWTAGPMMVLDVLVYLLVIYYWVMFFMELVAYKRSTGGILGFFTQFWNLLELTNLVTFVVMFVIRWMWMGSSSSAKKDIQFPFHPSYPPHLDRLMNLYFAQVYTNSVNTILTFLKFLKFVRLNERLNVLTRTIALCQQSIVGVLVLFVFVILGYGITAWGLFGINMEGFRNLGVSMSTLLRILVGEMDYEAMRKENRFLTGAFFWSFVVLALFLLLNFLIAIISEAFAKVSGKAFTQEFDEIVLRWWQQTKAQLAPHNLRRQFNNWCAGKSELKMLRLAAAELKDTLQEETARETEARRLRNEAIRSQNKDEAEFLLELEDTDEIVILMFRHHWREWVSEEIYETLGEYYFDYTWEDILNDYDDARKSSEEVDKRRMFETVQQGVEKAVGDEIQKIEKLDEMLAQLETETTRIISALGPTQD